MEDEKIEWESTIYCLKVDSYNNNSNTHNHSSNNNNNNNNNDSDNNSNNNNNNNSSSSSSSSSSSNNTRNSDGVESRILQWIGYDGGGLGKETVNSEENIKNNSNDSFFSQLFGSSSMSTACISNVCIYNSL